jgi:sigma-B regulation protein RsbQ
MTATKRNNVKIVGSGDEVLMFAHGYGCDQNMWRHVWPEFSDRYKIVLFDYVGSGLSDSKSFDQTRYSSLRGYSLDVVEILDELDLKRVHFVGHSVSSMIGALAYLKTPERFETITMIGPSPCYINSEGYAGGFAKSDIDALLAALESNHVAWSATMAPVIMGNPTCSRICGGTGSQFLSDGPLSGQSFCACHISLRQSGGLAESRH